MPKNKSQTVYHMSNGYGSDQRLSFSYHRTESSDATVQLNEERSAAAHRFIVNLCEEQLKGDTPVAPFYGAMLAAPSPAKDQVIDADFDEEIPF